MTEVTVGAYEDDAVSIEPANKGGALGWFSAVAECELPFFARSAAGDLGDGADSSP
ncbi:BZ3500_MvSof-1268-A1-R1_Chr1-1g01015 [Microbotryum saponariae]|uniref:BZ3500_MvSof-1268-A1-R1_Chr1-1g01015 protein n=1 Tax=Microbotryum saponariae TaxID=289078 RepID=A0A2X0KET2_9BASI|nr:BZ3500_MvSof-1268-A1-R1_Chr1-1g01015 [Microbotryum saponariae]SCZ93186.1 BZ3501_MvSof-1269-A2-R1_Chr1-1g00612 [Microbotryum saponariae]